MTPKAATDPSYESLSSAGTNQNTLSLDGTSFETLPCEVILGLLLSLKTFGILHQFICASPTALRIFNCYKASILKSLAFKIAGIREEAWADVLTVLTYQRHINETGELQYWEALKADMNAPILTFKTCDITHLLANEVFYKSVAEDLRISRSWRILISQLYHLEDRTLHPSFNVGDKLSLTYFYKCWAYALHFAYEPVLNFASRPLLTLPALLDLNVFSWLVSQNKLFPKFVHSPRFQLGNVTIGIPRATSDLFTLSTMTDPQFFETDEWRKNPILQQKTIQQSDMGWDGNPENPGAEGDQVRRYLFEYPVVADEVQEEYGEYCGWGA